MAAVARDKGHKGLYVEQGASASSEIRFNKVCQVEREQVFLFVGFGVKLFL